MISTEQIKELRDATGVSVMQCKKALEEAQGDMKKAVLVLQKKSKDIALKKAERSLGAGTIAAYIHGNGNVGAMVELMCETDFVAKNEEFKTLAYDVAMHVAALNPEFMKKEEIPSATKQSVSEMFSKDLVGKPEAIKEKILSGKLDAYFSERVLLEQNFVKDPDMTVRGLLDSFIQKFGEKIEVGKFARFGISEN